MSIGQFAAPKELKFMTTGKDMPGGNILKFNAFHLLEMKVESELKDGDPAKGKYGFDGIIVKVKCVKNKLFTPNVEIRIVGSFVNGFSNFWTNYKFLVDNKRLVSGSWNYLIEMPEKKFRTKDAESIYETDTSFRQCFDKVVKETIQSELIDRYK